MRYVIRRSYIDVVGLIWMPMTTCSLRMELRDYDIENMRESDGMITRESVEQWLCANAGDFSSIQDFYATIEDGEHTIEFNWATEDGEQAYLDTLPDLD